MPNYEYECGKCKKTFAVILSLKEHETAKVACPHCGGKDVKQLFSAFFAKTDRKS
ncbi:MAG: zinc ribbon domain-containing protein [Nitrospirota bacterium]|jgi:putative FmdB family regulatory protein